MWAISANFVVELPRKTKKPRKQTKKKTTSKKTSAVSPPTEDTPTRSASPEDESNESNTPALSNDKTMKLERPQLEPPARRYDETVIVATNTMDDEIETSFAAMNLSSTHASLADANIAWSKHVGKHQSYFGIDDLPYH